MKTSSQILNVVRLLGVGLGICLAFVAQASIAGSLGQWTLTLYGAALGLFLLATTRAGHLAQPNPADAKPAQLSVLQSALWVLSWALMIASTWLFISGSNRFAWGVHFGAIAAFLTAFLPFEIGVRVQEIRTLARNSGRRNIVISVALFALVLAVAIGARSQALGTFPEGVWFDEGMTGLIAMRMLEEPTYRPVYISETQLPAHFNYLVALAFQLFGTDITSIRLVPTIMTIGAIGFAFLLFRRRFGLVFGFIASFLFAVARWSLTLSRFGVNGHLSLFWLLGSLYFLDRAWEKRRHADFALAGIFFGMGLNFYYAFRLFAVALLTFLAIQGIQQLLRALRARALAGGVMPILRAWVSPTLALLFGTLVSITPVAQFAVRNPKDFFERTSTVSIFNNREEPDLVKALTTSVTKHALMFNVRGDANGRHNLPGAPMLDWITGALFVLGLAWTITRFWQPFNLLMLLSFGALMQAGILSVDFEAPQGYRTNLVIFIVAFFAAIPLSLLWKLIQSLQWPKLRIATRAIFIAGSALILSAAGQSNIRMFYVNQRYSNSAWGVQSVGETFAGREMARLAQTHDLIVSNMFANTPSQRFLAPKVNGYKVVSASDVPALPTSPKKDVAYILDHGLLATYKQLQKNFPNARFRELVGPEGGNPTAFTAEISRDDIRRLNGGAVRVFENAQFEGSAKTLWVDSLRLDSTSNAPAPNTPAPPGAAVEIISTLAAPTYGTYQFQVSGGSNAKFWIDEFEVNPATGIRLSRGNHALRVQLRLRESPGIAALQWQVPGSSQWQDLPDSAMLKEPIVNSGILGRYFQNPNWTGEPTFMQMDPQINFYFHVVPLPRPYSIEWVGKVYAPVDGNYVFGLRSIDESTLSIDDKSIITNARGQQTNNTVSLTKGWHDLVMRFVDRTSYTEAYLYWTPPSRNRELVPESYLRPPMGKYPSDDEMSRLLSESIATPKQVEIVRQAPQP